ACRTECAGRWWDATPKNEWPDDDEDCREILRSFQKPWGDRRQELVVIGLGPDEPALRAMLDACLLTDAELAAGPAAWAALPDPFTRRRNGECSSNAKTENENERMNATHILRHAVLAALTSLTLAAAHAASGPIVHYYVGIDGRQTLVSGPFTGRTNPAYGRLQLLYAHAYDDQPLNNHYHSIGAHAYVGDTNNPTIVPTNSNNRIPETYTGQEPLTLVPGGTNYPGKLVSAPTAEHYSDLTIRSVHTLRHHVAGGVTNTWGWGSGPYMMYYSSGGTRTNTFPGAKVAWELVEKSPELHVGVIGDEDALKSPGDRVILGEGDHWEAKPIVWADAATPAGHYYVRLKLVDLNGTVPESGIATFDYQVSGGPMLDIASTVTLGMPLATDGYVLESAPTPDGPWTAVEGAQPREQDNARKTLSLPVGPHHQFFRMRRL
ncbi:MAG TPA: all3515 family Zur-repressed PEP-CTERM protein, partial [Verrucomicrobiota bacterium]|nr:all3515 family Zur-repressed PEP-CTERM protein [Verrucomicrobiota bacterium]